MHNRAEPRYDGPGGGGHRRPAARRSSGRVARRRRRGTRSSSTRASGSARRPSTTSRSSATSGALRVLGRPILLGTSRKSTLGQVLDLPADQRLEATLATTALGIAAGVDIVRVHDVRAERPGGPDGRRHRPRRPSARRPRTGRLDDRPDRARTTCASRAATASSTGSSARPQPFEVDVELVPRPPAGRASTTTSRRRSTTAPSSTHVREIVESTSFRLLEALAEAIAHELLADFAGRPRSSSGSASRSVQLGGPLDYAGVEIRAARAGRRARLTAGTRAGPAPRDAGVRGRVTPTGYRSAGRVPG